MCYSIWLINEWSSVDKNISNLSLINAFQNFKSLFKVLQNTGKEYNINFVVFTTFVYCIEKMEFVSFKMFFPYFCKTLLFNNTPVPLRKFIKEFFNLEIYGTE